MWSVLKGCGSLVWRYRELVARDPSRESRIFNLEEGKTRED
jgi:hypothetical protein